MKKPRPTTGLKRGLLLGAATLALGATAALASETIGYDYDARGRLVTVVRTATASGSTTGYAFDKADNRLQRSALTLPDPSFELPEVGTGYVYSPTVSGMTFNSHAGVTGNSSAFGFVAAPDGDQVAFLQSTDTATGAMSLTVSGLVTGASYRVRFRIARRPNNGLNGVTVAADGTTIGSIVPPSNAFTSYETGSFTAAGPTALISFTGTTALGDRASALDLISIVPS
jgi:YD repeat-containing protein